MFIEKLRHVKKRWRVPALVLIVLLVIGLLSSFAFLGASYGDMGGGTTESGGIDFYATSAENAEKAVKKSPKNTGNILEAVTAYDDYATYQVLYLDDKGAKESYTKMLKYSNDLLMAYGKSDASTVADAQWSAAYMYNMRANFSLDDVESARGTFKASLTATTLTSEYINSYAALLAGEEMYDYIVEDMGAAAAIVEPLAEETKDDEDTEESGDATDTTKPETPADVLTAANTNMQYAQMMLSMNTANTDTTNTEDKDTTSGEADKEAE